MLTFIGKVLADQWWQNQNAQGISGIVGTIESPITKTYGGIAAGGLTLFISNILRLLFVVAGIYALFNFVIAGYQYMTSAGDSKALSAAWSRIWLSLFGLVLIVGSFGLAALFGYLLFGKADFILNPTIYGP